MPNIGIFHPQLVHFVVALGVAGVLLRLVSLSGRLLWTGPAAALALVVTGVVGIIAAEAGHQAHGLAEQIPGAREAVHEHEEAGELARNVFVVVGLLEIAALALRRRQPVGRWVLVASGLMGVGGVVALYEAGEHGGRLVYSYAGGVGTRSGDPADVRRLLIAGLYHEARAARDSGRADEAARLTDELARQLPDDPAVKLLVIESLLRDKQDPHAAIAALAAVQPPPNDRSFEVRRGLLLGDAYVAAGSPDSARAVLAHLAQRFPNAPMVQDALAKLPK
ncbi:MAG TPA: DUF2231 domain-containing protein [Gemmatimonadales bacterium]|jgi:uncharacterized membrane protein